MCKKENIFKTKKTTLVIILILFIVFLAFIYFFYIQPKYFKNISEVKNQNINENIDYISNTNDKIYTENGTEIEIIKNYDENMFKGKETLIFFWASWCTHCLEEISVISQSMKEFSNKGYNIYAISHDNDIDELVKFMNKENIKFKVYYDEKRTIRANIDPPARTIPLLYVINENISIVQKNEGSFDINIVKDYIKYIKTGK